MTKPADTSSWATSGVNRVTPSAGQISDGWAANGVLSSSYLNDRMYWAGQWTAWLNETAADEVDDIGSAIFGDGSDGDVTISSLVTLTRDQYYDDLTIANGGELRPDGYRIFVRGTLAFSGDGIIHANGGAGGNGTNAGGAGTPGAAGAVASSTGLLGAGSAGGAGAPTAGSANSNALGGQGGSGGNANVAGSAGGAVTAPTTAGMRHLEARLGRVESGTSFVVANGGSGGGGGGTGTGSPAAQGGGGGAGGGVVSISAKILDLSGAQAGRGIRADGGNGGNGGNNGAGVFGGGGGGGGGGGLLLLCYRSLIGTEYSAAGGTGGTGGTGSSAAQNGADGADGTVLLFRA